MDFYNFDSQFSKRHKSCSNTKFIPLPKTSMKSKSTVVAPLKPIKEDLKLDTPENPYNEKPEQCGDTSVRLTFEPITHTYRLVDKNGMYSSDYITSASCLLEMWKVYKTMPSEGNGPPPLLAAIQKSKNSSFFSSGAMFNKSVDLVQNHIVDYLNMITLNPKMALGTRQHLTFVERKDVFTRLNNTQGKDFSQFFPGEIWKLFESWAADGKLHESPPGVSERHSIHFESLVRFMGGKEGLHKIKCEQTKRFLANYHNDAYEPISGKDIALKYGVAAEAGTALHSYLEHRLRDPQKYTPEVCRQLFPCREEEDYIQCEEFIASGIKFDHLEKRLSSYRHKVCGSCDAMRLNEAGEWEMWDYKRTGKMKDAMWWKSQPGQFKIASLQDAAISDDIVKFAVQLSVYRKLAYLMGMGKVSKYGHLVVFHPTLKSYTIIRINLDEKTNRGRGSNLGGLGGYSPIEIVEIIFETLESEFTKIFGKR